MKKILIVDDESFNRMAILSMLEIIGVKNLENCVEAQNGQVALNVVLQDIQNNNFKNCSFDLIIMDFQMPVMDGNTSTQKIRELLYSYGITQPIICGVTGHVEQSYIKRMIKSGMNQVLSKPAKRELLKKTLEKLEYV